jgi:hypothetical protein
MSKAIEKIYEMLGNNDISNLSEMKEWFLTENEIQTRERIKEEIKKERFRIWSGLFYILPQNDFSDLKNGDKLHKLIFKDKD